MADFGRECYKTWRKELLASFICAVITFGITVARDSLALSNLRIAVWGALLTLAAFALFHLLATGYRITKPDRESPAVLPAVFGGLIILGMIGGSVYAGILINKNRAIPLADTTTTPAADYQISGGLQFAVLSTDDPVKLVVLGHIVNRATPLMLHNWRVFLAPNNSAEIPGIIQPPPDKEEVIPLPGTAHFTFPKGPTLDSITKGMTLPRAAMASGWMLVVFPLTQRDLKMLYPARIVVSVDDPTGRPYFMEGGPFTGTPVRIPISSSSKPPCIKIGELTVSHSVDAIVATDHPCIDMKKATITDSTNGLVTGPIPATPIPPTVKPQ
jgi:hypothetical protein